MMLDLLLNDARVLTMDDRRPRARTVGVLHGRIVGLDEEVAGLSARSTIDCDGAVLTPGFADAHNHMAWYGLALCEVDLAGCATMDQVYEAVARRAATLPTDGWVIGAGYDDTVLGGHPHRAGLDRAADGRPVWLKHRSGHLCAVSGAVLELAGVLAGTATVPEGGVVVRDAHGEPTGELQEQAQRLVMDLVTPYPTTELAAAIARAAKVYASEGLTQVTEAGIGGGLIGRSPIEAAAYLAAREQDELPVRVELMVASDALHPLARHAADTARFGLDLGLRTGFGDEMLRLGPMKIFLDGSLVGRTAAVGEPYCDHGHGTGYLQSDGAELEQRVVDAHDAGWQVAAHAIGDRAVDLALDALERAQQKHPRTDVRHRIEHAAVVRPDQLARMAELGVVPVPQPRFLYEIGDTMAAALGDERVDWMYRHRSFLDAGLRVPGSSDRPVAAGAPLLGMQSMVERRSRDGRVLAEQERVDAATALRAYTVDAAWAGHAEHRQGRIAPGLFADLVLLDDDPTTVPASRIGDISVQATFVGGRCVHGADHIANRAAGPMPDRAEHAERSSL
ncbi:MAG TPA: amidohydrolase [Jatrophihabitans sp.]|nr:amidohydrolase [Jatrophihabitans sp.]